MKKEIKRNTLVCVLDESTTASSLSNDLFFAMKRVQMESPKLNCTDVHITTEARDGQIRLYAEWTSEENNYEEKVRTEEEEIVSKICEAVKNHQTEVTFNCDYMSEESILVTRVVTRMYHSEPGRIIWATPLFDENEVRQIGIRVNIKYVSEYNFCSKANKTKSL